MLSTGHGGPPRSSGVDAARRARKAGEQRVGTGREEDPHPKSEAVASLSACEMARELGSGSISSVEIAEELLGRWEAIDTSGPHLRSVIEIAPDVLETAAALDAERRSGRSRGPLHGVPVLVKDNIDTVFPLHTTGGSLVFGNSSPASDAHLVRAMRDAGMFVLGKTNLSEWANFRGQRSSSGWSAAGGQTRNPHALDRTPGGSSAGSGSGVAARLAPLAIGTETDGSILCPSAACGVAGLKPTVGLVSRTGIIPISSSQDTAGPMARTTEDLALLLEVLARAVGDGEDPQAVLERRPPGHQSHYLALLGDGNLAGLRLGVLREGGYFGYHPATDKVFETMLEALSGTGAEVVDPLEPPGAPMVSGEAELVVLAHEFRARVEAYFERRAASVGSPGIGGPSATALPRTLEDVIAHAEAEPEERLDLFGIELITKAASSGGLDSPVYLAALEKNRRSARTEGLDKLFTKSDRSVDAFLVPAMPPAWLIDHVVGDAYVGSGWSPAAVAGYPSATLPMGKVGGLPVGVAICGPPWSEATLLRVMFALERALGTEITRPLPHFVDSLSWRT
ncbi:MAG: amidase [Acidimicrobiales bacterium]